MKEREEGKVRKAIEKGREKVKGDPTQDYQKTTSMKNKK